MENLLTMMTNLPQSIGASTSEDAQTQLDIQQNKMKQQESVSSSDEPKDPYSLLYMFSSMYASVLEDTITSTRILGECNNELRIIKALADMVQLRAKKYNIVQPTIADELEGINVKDLANEQNKLIKLANDRKFAYDTLMATYLDLSLNRSYKALDRTISESMERKKRNNDLLEAEAKNRAVRKDLARRLRLQRNHIKSAGYDTDLTIDGLRTQVEDIGLAAEIRSRYVTRWQVARAEQHHQTIKDKEFSPLMTIELYKTRIDHEQRVHSEVELLINLTINEKLEQVETWMNKYDKDIEKMDLKIQIMKNNHVTTLEERTQLEDTFNKHDKLMKDWVHFKEEREKARLYREKMTNSAITVQAWWRGLLVRLQLGPYKPVKKGKGAKKAKKYLSYFVASIYGSILEDTITEMRILGECNNEFRIIKTRSDMGQLLAKKYGVEQPFVKDELDGIDSKNLGKAQYKLDKLASDRKYIYESLVLTYIDLTMNQSFVDLIGSITEVVDRLKKRVLLSEDEAKNKATRRELAKQLRQQRNHIKSVNYDTDLMIEDLKTQVEDTALRSEIRSRFISKWQVARSEQHHQTIRVKESRPLETIEYYKTRTDNEQRVHSEVELMANITINEKLEMVETWMTKYDKDMEKMDLKIQIKKNDYQNKLDYRMELEDTFNKHDKLMKDWVHFKEEREKARLYREKMTNSAITVQAWWRGLLVRLQLGPYKPVKKGKGAAAKKKK